MDEVINILLVDDNKDFCGILNEYFSDHKDLNICGTIYNGSEAFDAIQEKEPDVVILDIIMPHLDGIGVLEKLDGAELIVKPKIIVLTTLGQETMAQQACDLGADYYILKPFDLDVLGARIKQLVRGEVNNGNGMFKGKNMDIVPFPFCRTEKWHKKQKKSQIYKNIVRNASNCLVVS